MNCTCPVCEEKIELEQVPIVGERITCDFCSTDLEVTKVDQDKNIVEVVEGEEVEEDWGE